jgi:hypothetical protein
VNIYENTWKNLALGLLVGAPVAAFIGWAIFVTVLGVRPLFVAIGILVYVVFLGFFTAWLKPLRDESSDVRMDPRYYVRLCLFNLLQVCGGFYALFLASALNFTAFLWLCGVTIVMVPPMFYVLCRQYVSSKSAGKL